MVSCFFIRLHSGLFGAGCCFVSAAPVRVASCRCRLIGPCSCAPVPVLLVCARGQALRNSHRSIENFGAKTTVANQDNANRTKAANSHSMKNRPQSPSTTQLYLETLTPFNVTPLISIFPLPHAPACPTTAVLFTVMRPDPIISKAAMRSVLFLSRELIPLFPPA